MTGFLSAERSRSLAGRLGVIAPWLLSAAAAALPLLQSARAEAEPLLAQASGSNRAYYDKAKRELGEPYYSMYRIVDRLARANALDQRPWRVKVEPAYDINAFASETNRLSIASGLIDQLAGDSAGLACVMGHEMAHHVHRHIALKLKDVATARQQVIGQAEEMARQQMVKEQSRRNWGVLTSILQQTTGIPVPVPIRGGDSPEELERKMNELATNAEQDLLAASRTMEMESDRSGYEYMARAGFDPQGCMRMLEVLARQSGAEFETTHPAIPRRIEQMRQLIQTKPAATLAAEGKARLRASRALTYDLSNDRNSLRINSRIAGSSQPFPDDL